MALCLCRRKRESADLGRVHEMRKYIAGLISLIILATGMLAGTASADNKKVETYKDDETGETYVDEYNYTTGQVTQTVTDSNGNVEVYTYSIEQVNDNTNTTTDSSPSTTSDETVKNPDGSITVVSKDQTDADYSDVDTSNTDVSSEDSSSGGLTQEEWEARMAKAISANGSVTETVYRDANGNIWPVQVEYMGLGRSSVIVNGERCLVPTSSLTWVTDAPDNKLLAVVTTEKQSYVTMRAKKSQKAFVMSHCEKCQVLRVISTGKTWTMVDCNGMRGYVLTNGLTFYDNAPKDYVTGMVTFRGKTTSRNMIHVRSGTTGTARQLQEFSCGTPLTIFSRNDKWCEVDVGGWHAYIKSEFVTMDEGAVLAAADPEYSE